jgi:coenzyme F420 hydrogenase subunit beta
MKRIKDIRQIVENDLCVRCGTCAAICPIDIITFNERYYPVVGRECTECGLCLEVCPVHDLNIPLLYEQVLGAKYIDNSVGVCNGVYVGHSTVPEIREKASSGGVVTQILLSLLKRGDIDGAIVATADPNVPWRSKAILATTAEEIIKSVGSRYTIIPVNERLKELRKFPGRIALVGLPCHVQSFRMWESIDSQIREKVTVVIGLFCNRNLEMEATTSLVRCKKINISEISALEYRGGTWPGGIRVKLKNGSYRELHRFGIKDGAYNHLYKIHYAENCLNCIDFCAELADISIADPWIRGADGDYMFKGNWSLVLTRTKRGKEIMCELEKAKKIVLKKIPESLFYKNFFPAANSKKKLAFYRIKRLMEKDKPYPNYHLAIPNFTRKELMYECLKRLSLLLSKNNTMKNLYMNFAFSKLGERLTKIKMSYKKYRYRIANSR